MFADRRFYPANISIYSPNAPRNTDTRIELIEELLDECGPARQTYLEEARRADFLFHNDSSRWILGTADEIPVGKHPVTTDNYIKPLIRDSVSLMLKNYPMFRLKAYREDAIPLTHEMNKHILAAWIDSKAQKTLEDSQLHAEQTGMTVLEVEPRWNPLREIQLEVKIVPREDIWFDPKVMDLDEAWAVRRKWFTYEELKTMERRRGWAKGSIDQALEGEMTRGWSLEGAQLDSLARDMPAPRYYPATAEDNLYQAERIDDDSKLPPYWRRRETRFPLLTAWIPPELLEDKYLDPRREDYSPFGRQWLMLGRRVIRDIPVPTAELPRDRNEPIQYSQDETGRLVVDPNTVRGHRRHPFVLHECHRLFSRNGYSGIYDVEGTAHVMEANQWNINELLHILMKLARLTSSPPLLIEDGGLSIPKEELDYAWGEVIPFDRNIRFEPRFLTELPGDPGLIMALLQQQIQAIREASGIRELMTGGGGERPGTSHTAQGAVLSAQESNYSRMWQKVHALDRAIEGIGQRMLGLMQQHYPLQKYQSVSLDGDTWAGQWQMAHMYNQFRVEVISGMTTPLRDIERETQLNQISQMVAPIYMQPTPGGIQWAIAHLRTLNSPVAYNFLQDLTAMAANFQEQAQLESLDSNQQQPLTA